jgi:hypothetical protein
MAAAPIELVTSQEDVGSRAQEEVDNKTNSHSWLRGGELLHIRRAGQGVPEPVPFLVNGILHEVGTSMLVGRWSSGKTFVVMDIAAGVLTGQPMAGRAVHRMGGVLWFAAEGEREVDKRIRAAVTAMGGDPEAVAFYTQVGSVPKLLLAKKEVGSYINQAQRACKAEFNVPLVLVVFDTMIKSAGYKKSENDSVEVNNAIQVLEDYAHAYQCHGMFIDHMGKDEDKGARGSSDKPSSLDTYCEIKNGKKVKQLVFEKIKGEVGDISIKFEIVGVTQDGQKTAVVQWGPWAEEAGGPGASLTGNDKALFECICDLIAKVGVTHPFEGRIQ